MNKKNLLITFLILIIFYSCGNSVRNAYDYNNIISEEEIAATECIYKFKAIVENEDYKEMERLKADCIQQLNNSVEAMDSLDSFNNSYEYRNAASALFKTYIDIFNNEFTSIIQLYKQNETNINPEIKNNTAKILKQVDSKVEAGVETLRGKQLAFAEQNKLVVASE